MNEKQDRVLKNTAQQAILKAKAELSDLVKRTKEQEGETLTVGVIRGIVSSAKTIHDELDLAKDVLA